MLENCNKFTNLKIYISGYGPFMNVVENPSQKLVEYIIENKNKLNPKCEIIYHTVFDVSVDYVKNNISNCHNIIKESKNENDLHLIIHFGVSKESKEINLECRAQNYIKDYVNLDCVIVENSNDHFCKLDLDLISNKLNEKHKVKTSLDAGTYLCNFVYFTSCQKFENHNNVIPVFIHIPCFDEVCLEDCSRFFFDFIQEVCQHHLSI